MWTLITLGVLAAYAYSLLATFLPGVFPEQYRMGGMVGTYYEAAVVIVTLVFVGQVLELRARERTGDAIRAVLESGTQIPRGASCRMAPNTMHRWKTSWRTTSCECAPETLCRWTASWCRAIHRWTKAC